MNAMVWHTLPRACGARPIEPGGRYRESKQCFVSVSWLAQQVFYLPCSAAEPLKGRGSAPAVTVTPAPART